MIEHPTTPKEAEELKKRIEKDSKKADELPLEVKEWWERNKIFFVFNNNGGENDV